MSSTFPKIFIFFLFSIGSTFAYTGTLPPPEVLAEEFFENFTRVLNGGNKEELKKLFAPVFLENQTTYKIYETISSDLSGFSFTINHAFFDIFKTPKKHWWLLNTTVSFRGPHPTYFRRHFNILLENVNQNSMLFPDQWKIRAMISKTHVRKSAQNQTPTPDMIMGHVMQEFLTAVNTRDMNRLVGMLDMKEVVSPTGMDQLYELLAGNRVEVRSAKFMYNEEISGTIVFTNPYGVANLFYFTLRDWDARNSYSWKITDMKMMYGGYGVPKGFVGNNWGLGEF